MHISILKISPNFHKGWQTWILLLSPWTAKQHNLCLKWGPSRHRLSLSWLWWHRRLWAPHSSWQEWGSNLRREDSTPPPHELSAGGPCTLKYQEHPQIGTSVQFCTSQHKWTLQQEEPQQSKLKPGGLAHGRRAGSSWERTVLSTSWPC